MGPDPSRGAGIPRFRLAQVAVVHGPVRAVDGVDLRIGAGEAVALVGPSGAGKTTVLRLLNGTVAASAGHVEVDGRDLGSLGSADLRRVRASIGFVHQDLALVPTLRVVQNVLAGGLGRQSFLGALRAMTWPRRDDVRRAYAILERVGVGDRLYERTDRLSGGQRQRVALARALYQRPTALLADEPVSSVDPARARDTVDLLTRVSREEGLTLVMSLHDIALAREFFPRLVGLRRGRVAFDRAAAEVAEADVHALYDLTADEMLEDGA